MKRIEMYCNLIDSVKALKLKAGTDDEINHFTNLENSLNYLLSKEIIGG